MEKKDIPENGSRKVLSVSQARALIMAVITIVSTILASYFGLKSDLQNYHSDAISNDKIQELQIKELDVRVNKLEVEMGSLKTFVYSGGKIVQQ